MVESEKDDPINKITSSQAAPTGEIKEISRETKYFIFSENFENDKNNQDKKETNNENPERQITYDEYIIEKIDSMKTDTINFFSNQLKDLSNKYDLLKQTVQNHINAKVKNISDVFGLCQNGQNPQESKQQKKYIQNYASKNIVKNLNNIVSTHEIIMKTLKNNIEILNSFLKFEDFIEKEDPIQEFLTCNLIPIYNSWLFLHLDFNKNNLANVVSNQNIPQDAKGSKIQAVKEFILKNAENKFFEMVVKEEENKESKENKIKNINLLNDNKDYLIKLKLFNIEKVDDYFKDLKFTKLTTLKFEKCIIPKVDLQETLPQCTKLSFKLSTSFDFAFLSNFSHLRLQKIIFEKNNLITSEFNKILNAIVQSSEITRNLTYLSFARNYITSVDLTQPYTLKLPELKEIDFRKNKIFKFLINPEACPKLKIINLSNNNLSKPIMSLGKKSKTIVLVNNNLYLTNKTICQKYYETLKTQLEQLDHEMKYLSLSGLFTKYTKENICNLKINHNIQISVKKLDLSYCSLDCETLFRFFANNPGFLELRVLNLTGNALTDNFFSEFLNRNLHIYFQKLSHLYLTDNKIEGKDFATVSKFINENKYLTRLALCVNPFGQNYTVNKIDKKVGNGIKEIKENNTTPSEDNNEVTDFCSLVKYAKFLNSEQGRTIRNFNRNEKGFYMKYDLYKKRYNYDNVKTLEKYVIIKKEAKDQKN